MTVLIRDDGRLLCVVLLRPLPRDLDPVVLRNDFKVLPPTIEDLLRLILVLLLVVDLGTDRGRPDDFRVRLLLTDVRERELGREREIERERELGRDLEIDRERERERLPRADAVVTARHRRRTVSKKKRAMVASMLWAQLPCNEESTRTIGIYTEV